MYLINLAGKRGQNVWTDEKDEEHLSRGVYDSYTQRNLRYSQVKTEKYNNPASAFSSDIFMVLITCVSDPVPLTLKPGFLLLF